MTKICKAEKVGLSIMLLDKDGYHIGTMDVTFGGDLDGIADQVVEALNAQASREGDQS